MENPLSDYYIANVKTLENSSPEIFRLILIRHGQTFENSERIFQGHLNTKLISNGISQAEKCGKRIDFTKIDRILSSDLYRCLQTTKNLLLNDKSKEFNQDSLLNLLNESDEEISQRSNLHEEFESLKNDKALKISFKFRERSFGTIEGMFIDDAIDFALNNGKTSYREFGESLKLFHARLFGTLNLEIEELLKTDNKNCILVTHGGSIRALIHHFINEEHFELNNILINDPSHVKPVKNTSVTIVDIVKRGNGKKGIVQVIGDISHLGGTEAEVEDDRVR